VLALLSSGVAIVKFFLCNDNNLWKSGLTISSNKSIFVPGDTMRISVSVTASQIDAATVDVYILVKESSGGFFFIIFFMFFRAFGVWSIVCDSGYVINITIQPPVI